MRTIRPLLAAVVAALAFASALLFGAAPASAHDAAESTSPASGATVAEVPASVSVTFNNRPLAIGSGMSVTAGGENWADGAVQIIDNQAVQKLRPGAPAGQYTVVWRVVETPIRTPSRAPLRSRQQQEARRRRGPPREPRRPRRARQVRALFRAQELRPPEPRQRTRSGRLPAVPVEHRGVCCISCCARYFPGRYSPSEIGCLQ